jgi:hypothetical protein
MSFTKNEQTPFQVLLFRGLQYEKSDSSMLGFSNIANKNKNSFEKIEKFYYNTYMNVYACFY